MCTPSLYGKDTAAGWELDSRFAIRPECQANVPKTHFKPKRRKTLSERRWKAALSEDGHLDIACVLRRVQNGGIHPSIKGIVWEFLLGCFDPNCTFDERNVLRQQRREQYEAWKTECKKMEPIVGTGKFVTTPVITDDGQPIQSPSIRSDLEDNGGAMPSDDVIEDKKVVQWKLSLHQIGL